jgi:hypothetical protein
MRLCHQGYRISYVPQARSYERVSLSSQDEVTRRARIVAGRYQAMLLAGHWLPWHRPLILWQIISHKFLRPLVPFAMIGALLTNLISVIGPSVRTKSRVSSPATMNWLLLTAQALFYLAAWLGNRLEGQGHALAKGLYLPTFLVNSNLAALVGLYRFITGRQTSIWQSVKRRQDSPLEPKPTGMLSEVEGAHLV